MSPCTRLDPFSSSLQQVQDELAGYVLELAPASLPAQYQIPFLSAGAEEVGQREENRGLSLELVLAMEVEVARANP